MTDIEKKALALLNEVFSEHTKTLQSRIDRLSNPYDEALCRAIEQHEAFKREVSDAVEAAKRVYGGHREAFDQLDRFIIAKPDPLVEALAHCVPLVSPRADETPAEFVAREVRNFLAENGKALKIVEDSHD